MKALYTATFVTVCIILFTVFGSIGYCYILGNLENMVMEANSVEECIEAVEYFDKWEFFFALVTSDGTLDNIKTELAGLQTYINFEDHSYTNAKSRLICQIKQLRQLLGFNPKSFI